MLINFFFFYNFYAINFSRNISKGDLAEKNNYLKKKVDLQEFNDFFFVTFNSCLHNNINFNKTFQHQPYHLMGKERFKKILHSFNPDPSFFDLILQKLNLNFEKVWSKGFNYVIDESLFSFDTHVDWDDIDSLKDFLRDPSESKYASLKMFKTTPRIIYLPTKPNPKGCIKKILKIFCKKKLKLNNLKFKILKLNIPKFKKIKFK